MGRCSFRVNPASATACSDGAQDELSQLEPNAMIPADNGKADGNSYSVKDFSYRPIAYQ